MAQQGRPLAGSTGVMAASTDMGNVSRRVPSLHPFVGIRGVDAALHTRDFAAAALGEEGLALLDDAAVAMAWIIRRAATDPEVREGLGVRSADLPMAR